MLALVRVHVGAVIEQRLAPLRRRRRARRSSAPSRRSAGRALGWRPPPGAARPSARCDWCRPGEAAWRRDRWRRSRAPRNGSAGRRWRGRRDAPPNAERWRRRPAARSRRSSDAAFSSARTDSTSWFFTAWISRRSVGAAATDATTSRAQAATSLDVLKAAISPSESSCRWAFERLAAAGGAAPACLPSERSSLAFERQNLRIDSSCAVANPIPVHAELIQQRQVEIGQRHVLEPDVPPALQSARRRLRPGSSGCRSASGCCCRPSPRRTSSSRGRAACRRRRASPAASREVARTSARDTR